MRMEIGKVPIVEKSEGIMCPDLVKSIVFRTVLRLRRFVPLVIATCR